MKHSAQSGFSLLEIVLTLGLILMLSYALTTLLRDSLDIREALAQNAKVNHRLATAMTSLVKDLEHAYIISDKDLARFGDPDKRKIQSIFKIEIGNEGDDLQFTTMSHIPMIKNARESETTFVAYKLEENRETGRTDLIRAETKRVPENFRDELNYRVLARGIKSFHVRPWRGDEWSKDRWDSRRREWRNRLPQMVKIELEAWEEDIDPEDASSRVTTTDEPTLTIGTVVILPNSMESEELKQRPTTLRWDKL
jgi:type II secretory pathway component PulJ